MAAKPGKYPFVSLYPVKSRWRITYTLAGRRITERLGVDEAKARKRARQVSELLDSLKSRLIDPGEVRRQLDDQRHVDHHVKAFGETMTHEHVGERYVALTVGRIKTLIELAGATRWQHLQPATVRRALEELRRKPVLNSKGEPTTRTYSDQTVNHYLRAVKQMANWMRRTGRGGDNDLPTMRAGEVRQMRDRRAPASDEIAYLIGWTWHHGIKRRHDGLPGQDRAMLYAFAIATGLRASELKPVERAWIRGDGDRLTLTVPGNYTKNGEPAVQPLPAWLATSASDWLAGKTGRLWPDFPTSTAKTLGRDLRDARAAWLAEAADDQTRAQRQKTHFLLADSAAGVWDFHAFRHGYVTRLIEGRVAVADVQQLARHSDANLTLGRYGHSEAAITAVDVLPDVMGRMREAQRILGDVSNNNDDKTSTTTNKGKATAPQKQRKIERAEKYPRQDSNL